MTAYMIILCKMHNREKFIGTYGKLVPSLVEKHGGEYLIVAPGATLLEGSLNGYESVAISKWPSKKHALRFWQSTEYEELKTLRKDLADVEVVIVESTS